MQKNKNKIISLKDSERIEKAVHFLLDKYQDSEFNEKPTLLHSLEAAFGLLRGGAIANVVKIAILHDIIKESRSSYAEIKKTLGEKIAHGVISLTEENIIWKCEKKYKKNLERIVKEGEDMILLKMVDMFNHSFYINLIKDGKKERVAVDKVGYFLKLAKDAKQKEIYQMLKGKYDEEKERLLKSKRKK
jgi:(p)ppGpp synthase/HD superfamily hydrolase